MNLLPVVHAKCSSRTSTSSGVVSATACLRCRVSIRSSFCTAVERRREGKPSRVLHCPHIVWVLDLLWQRPAPMKRLVRSSDLIMWPYGQGPARKG